MTPAVAAVRSAGTGADRGASLPVIPAAVAIPVLDLVAGELTPATILAAYSAAVVLCCEPRADRPARIVTVLAREASGVPNGVRTALTAADRPFRKLTEGDAAFVGGGGIQLTGMRLRAVRTVRTAVSHITPSPRAVRRIGDVAGGAPRGVADEPVGALRAALATGDAAGLRAAVRALVGLGTGSTPGGDDVLAGTMAGLLATDRAVLAHQIAAALLPDLAARTPVVSADLLRLAAQGNVCTEAGAVILAAAEHGCRSANPSSDLGSDLDRALARLLAIGHTSGADMATGLAIGLGVPDQPRPRQPRRSRVRMAGATAW
ncbi:MAG: hypothetical protein BGO26_19730 [Actinobacteria bacterium 69-20]|jgi:hypothetical protein|nr:DUF2877 domain-containing protein [Actinomycetota bacterium]OJV24757.1 MAG: hypothetical protein BGO26_19730 [Actinobacteria bacterium 69-20]